MASMKRTCPECAFQFETSAGEAAVCPICETPVALPSTAGSEAGPKLPPRSSSRWLVPAVIAGGVLVLIVVLPLLALSRHSGPSRKPREEPAKPVAVRDTLSTSGKKASATASRPDTSRGSASHDEAPRLQGAADTGNAPRVTFELTSPEKQFTLKPTDADYVAVDFEGQLEVLRAHGLDIVLTFDSTASMGEEIAEVKERIQRIGTALRLLVPGVRVSICTYRDKGDDYLVKGLPLTDDLRAVERYLKPIRAAGGGDEPEAVQEGLRWAVQNNVFRPNARKVILLFGDAPPHKADIDTCLRFADGFHRYQHGIVSTIVVRTDEIPEFVRIAKAGGGESFRLADHQGLMLQLLVLVFGSEHKDKVLRIYRLLEEVEPDGGLLEGKPLTDEGATKLVRMLAEADPKVRISARLVLGAVGRPAVPYLLKALAVKEQRVEATAALAVMGPVAAAAIPALIQALASPDEDFRRAAPPALARIGKPAVPALVEALQSPNAEVAGLAMLTVGGIGPAAAEAIPALSLVLRHPDRNRRLLAIQALLRIEPAGTALRARANECVEALRAALAHPEPRVRAWAASAIGKLGVGAESAAPDLERLLNAETDAAVRVEAAAALGQLRPTKHDVIPALLRAAEDPVPAVQRSAGRALLCQGRRALAHADPEVRRRVLAVLKVLGASVKGHEEAGAIVAELLRTIRKDADAELRAAAIDTLAAIDPMLAKALPAYEAARGRREPKGEDLTGKDLRLLPNPALVAAVPAAEGELLGQLLEELRRRCGEPVLVALLLTTQRADTDIREDACKALTAFLANRPTVDLEQRAAAKLKLAQDLALARKVVPAERRYREIVEEYPATAAAEEARVRLAKK